LSNIILCIHLGKEEARIDNKEIGKQKESKDESRKLTRFENKNIGKYFVDN